jgi:hypothetical protein
MKKKTIEKVPEVHLKLHTTFGFAIYENALNTTMALSQSGYFINIIKESGAYRVYVYIRK